MDTVLDKDYGKLIKEEFDRIRILSPKLFAR